MAGEAAPFTPEVGSPKQMQSEHTLSDDTPVDVNANSIHGQRRDYGHRWSSYG